MDRLKGRSSVSFLYLIKVFSFIGATSFGGYTALVSYVQKRLVDEAKLISEEELLDSVTIASLLPGPLAVNVVANIGYSLRGWMGTVVSMAAVLSPSVLLMILAAEFYQQFGDLETVGSFLNGIILAICAVIFSVVNKMSQKNLKAWWQVVLAVIAATCLFFFKAYLVIVFLLVFGGVNGLLLSKVEASSTSHKKTEPFPIWGALIIVGIAFAGIVIFDDTLLRQLIVVFSKVSVTLFGGGYVMIPVLYNLVVEQQNWVSPEAFSVAISLGQMTPGPILVSATFVGYLVKGISGGIISTAAIFLPSAIVMVLVSNRFEYLKSSNFFLRALQGIRPVIIGLIAYSAVVIFMSDDFSFIRLFLAAVAGVLLIFTKINDFLLILLFGCLGLIWL